MITIENLTKKYGDFVALDSLDLEVPRGELFCFLGPNGAGKTTTIKVLTGLLRPTHGVTRLGGIDIHRDPVAAKRILGYIPDMPYLYDRLTTTEFFRFTGDLYDIDRRRVAEREEELFTLFGLLEHRNALVKDLSHGLRQRLIYASTFLHEPRILFIDEPLIGLDPYTIRLIKDLLRQRARDGMTIFRSDEIPFLLVRPFRMSDIVVYKFLESTTFSSWSFFFIVVPFVAAYAVHLQLTPLFAVWTLLLAIPFLLTSAGIGALAVMVIVRWSPRLRAFRMFGLLFAVIITGSAWWFVQTVYEPVDTATFDISRMVPGFRLAASPFLPSAWYADGVMSLARGRWMRGVLMAMMLASTAGVLTVAVEWLGARTFYATWLRVVGSRDINARTPVLFSRLDRLLTPMAADMRAMWMKDIRLFFRDPMQWSQALVFFGLLALYFANLRTFNYNTLSGHWRSLVAFLNVFSVSAVMCSLGSRFVFPQLSLEGQGFWVLGLSPTTMPRVVLAKFALAVASLLTVSVALILLSTAMLNTPLLGRAVSVVLVACVAMAVCGLSCELGAVFLGLRQRNPSAIVSGFGGTLNLVLSLAFMLAAIVPFGLAFHLNARLGLVPSEFRWALAFSSLWLVFLTAISVALPLWLGTRSLRDRDF